MNAPERRGRGRPRKMAPIKLTEAQSATVHALHPPPRDTLAQQIAAVGREVASLREQISVALHALQQDVTAVRSMAIEAETWRGERAARKAVKQAKKRQKQKRTESP